MGNLSLNRSPTIADVARQANVSIATVSRVLNGTTPVIEDTAERVRLAIKDLRYVPRAAARVLASRRTETIGLLLPEIGGAFFPPLLRGIEAEARLAGFDLLIHATTHLPHASEPAPGRPLGEHNTDGLIIFAQSIGEIELFRLHELGFPSVLIYQTAPASLEIPSVTIENKSGAQNIVEHLLNVHQCRRIAFLRGPEGNEDSEQREQGYRKALEAHGIPFDPTLVGMGGFNEIDAQIALRNILTSGTNLDAVFCGDDDTAVGVLMALRQAGKNVPKDVKVVGFDDSPVARLITPTLTTVRAPTEQVGQEAVRQLICLIRGRQAESLTLMPTELIIRETCGCKPNADIWQKG
jgi:LacI family transcriptional regulator